jgi:phosphoribosyl 1,2-cyclic phosphodiesterase
MRMDDALDIVMRPPVVSGELPIHAGSEAVPSRRGPAVRDRGPSHHSRPASSSGRSHRLSHRAQRGLLALATDVEHGEPDSDRKLREIANNANVLVYDAQYLPDEYESGKIGWGHSTWAEAVALAKECNVGRLILTSHDPSRSDDEVDKILAMARAEFPNTDAFYEGMVLEVR